MHRHTLPHTSPRHFKGYRHVQNKQLCSQVNCVQRCIHSILISTHPFSPSLQQHGGRTSVQILQYMFPPSWGKVLLYFAPERSYYIHMPSVSRDMLGMMCDVDANIVHLSIAAKSEFSRNLQPVGAKVLLGSVRLWCTHQFRMGASICTSIQLFYW